LRLRSWFPPFAKDAKDGAPTELVVLTEIKCLGLPADVLRWDTRAPQDDLGTFETKNTQEMGNLAYRITGRTPETMNRFVLVFASAMLAAVVILGVCVPAYASPAPRGDSQARADAKANRRQAKAQKKYAKQQKKAEKKMLKMERKNTHYPKQVF